jgi:hypothetical protein
MSVKLKEFATKEHLRAVGHSKGYIFKHDLLAEAGVKPNEEFRVLVSARKIVFEYSEPTQASVIVPRPLSYYLKQRVKAEESAVVHEVWPDDAPRGKERLE